jgi:hypothetical protein
MRPSRVDILAAVLAEPSGITTRQLAEKLATVPHQIRPSLSKLAAYGHISKTVISARGDAVWGPISSPSPAISPELPAASCLVLEPHGSCLFGAQVRQLSGRTRLRGHGESFRLKKTADH